MKNIIAILIALVVASATVAVAQTEEPKNAIYGEVSCGTMYHGFDVGGQFFPDPVCKTWVNYDRKVTNRTSVSFGTWMQKAANAPSPNDAEEIDLSFSVTYAVTPKTSVMGSVANYTIHALNLQKFAVAVSREFTLGKQPITLSNETAAFTSTRPSLLKGGFVNRTEVSTSYALTKRTALSGGIAITGDNGPFGLGGPAMMGFANARIDQQLTKRFGIFAAWKGSRPLAGSTVRGPLNSFEAGISFRFEF